MESIIKKIISDIIPNAIGIYEAQVCFKIYLLLLIFFFVLDNNRNNQTKRVIDSHINKIPLIIALAKRMITKIFR